MDKLMEALDPFKAKDLCLAFGVAIATIDWSSTPPSYVNYKQLFSLRVSWFMEALLAALPNLSMHPSVMWRGHYIVHGDVHRTKCQKLVVCDERLTITCGVYKDDYYSLGNLVCEEESYSRKHLQESKLHSPFCYLLPLSTQCNTYTKVYCCTKTYTRQHSEVAL